MEFPQGSLGLKDRPISRLSCRGQGQTDTRISASQYRSISAPAPWIRCHPAAEALLRVSVDSNWHYSEFPIQGRKGGYTLAQCRLLQG